MAARHIGSIEPYEEGEDFKAWCERFSCFLDLNKITEENERRSAVLTLVGKKSYVLLRNLVSPHVPSTKTYDELKTVLANHFEPKPNKTAIRFSFIVVIRRRGRALPYMLLN